MIVYCVTKNDPLTVVYLGTSVEEAEESVGDFTRYQKTNVPVNFQDRYTLIPKILEPEMIQFYAADGWWYSIVMFELKETTNA